MIRRADRVQQFESEDTFKALVGRTPEEALARYGALWAEARALRPDLGADWRSDLEADFAIARAINGLPPRP